jgi:hypothetical protein
MECTFDLHFNSLHPDSKTTAKFASSVGRVIVAYSFTVPETVGKRLVKLARGIGKSFHVSDPDQAKFRSLLELLVKAGAKFKTYTHGEADSSKILNDRYVGALWSLTPYKALKRATPIDDPQIFILTAEFAEKQNKSR